MKRICLCLTFLFFLGLTACSYENEDYVSDSALILPTVPIFQVENVYGLKVAQTSSNGFGVGFLVRNRTGHRLYYNDDFRVDGVALSESNNPAGVQFINHGDTKDTHVNWSDERRTGMYTFERDFFLDVGLTELYKTLTFDFGVIGWYHFTDNAPPIPEDLQASLGEQIRNNLAFQIAGGPSQIIVLASEVVVSRTEIAFSTVNLSTQPFMHGLSYSLLIYDNGWKPAPAVTESRRVLSIGFGMQGGEVIEDHINFEGWYGVLENGRYMFMRHHSEDHSRPGVPRVQETLMVEFFVDDSTPMRLGDELPAFDELSLFTHTITPTGLMLYVTNPMSREFFYSKPFIVQKYVYGNWENIYEIASPERFHVSVPANETVEIRENWVERFGMLPPGRYQFTAHFGTMDSSRLVTQEFLITQEAFDEYIGDSQLNSMFKQNIIATNVSATPVGITIRWENTSDQIFYTPWTGYWVERYSPEEGRDWNRLRESFDSTFYGPDANLRQVTIEMSGGGAMTFYTTAVHPGQHIYQSIEWEGELPVGQYVISLGHFNPNEPGFMYWIRPWERFSLQFEIQ